MGLEMLSFQSVRRLRPAELIYSRGAYSVELVGLRSNPQNRRFPSAQVVINLQGEDFLLSQAELILNDEVTEPQPGDRITELIGGSEVTYEVIRMSDEICWRWIGFEHEVIRVHTKRVSY